VPAPPDVLVVPHTHWDREWYHLAGRFRQRLVALVDELLDADDGAPFLLDGQAVVLDDYLAVRPERRDALAAALRSGHLDAGPWYVLADGLIPGGESLVRNLLAGRRTLARLGATPPAVLYAPDAFGHPAAHPAVACGFGLPVAIVWRGYGGPRWPAGDAAWWAGPDGARVLLSHLPPDGYEFGSRLPPTLPAARERWAVIASTLAPRARLGCVLLPNGADHHARQERWAEAIEALRRAAEPARVEVVSLSAFAERARRAADAAELPTVTGELRDSYGYAWALQGTFGTRAAQKRRAAEAERALVRDVEPWAALAAIGARRGDAVPAADTRRALLDAAWRELLLCHPHDTLCGCSLDGVARAMDARLDEVGTQVDGLRRDALDLLVGHDVVRARGLRTLWRPQVLVRNRAARARGGVAEVAVATFVRDVAVGPGSAGTWTRVRAPAAPVRLALDSAGGAVPGEVPVQAPVQVLARTLAHDRVESPRHYPDDDLVEVARAVAWVPPVAGYGSVALALAGPNDWTNDASPAAPRVPVRAHDGTLDNGILRVGVDARGRASLRIADDEIVLDDLIGFEDVGDGGDLYTHSPVGERLTAARCVGIRTVDRGPLRATLEARYELRVPEALAVDAEDPLARPSRRAGRAVDLPITIRLTLDADAPFLRVRVTGNNRARDHRLRVVFRTGLADARVIADAAFGPVERRPIEVSPAEARVERAPATAPLHRYVSLSRDGRGATVFSDGLAEYEATPAGDVAVTLVRAVGELSRPDLPERPGHAGWPAATPEAQGPGPFVAHFAVALHAPDSDGTRALVERLADDVLLPLTGDTVRAAVHALDGRASLALLGDALAFSAAKPAERGDGWVALRAVNVGDAACDGAWRIVTAYDRPVRDALRARLDETPADALPVERDGDAAIVRFRAGPREAVTVLVR